VIPDEGADRRESPGTFEQMPAKIQFTLAGAAVVAFDYLAD
jgi:hypothetical protein